MRFIKRSFCRYMIVDDHGTEQYAWTFKGALAWLEAASSTAWVVDLYRMNIAVQRNQYRVY